MGSAYAYAKLREQIAAGGSGGPIEIADVTGLQGALDARALDAIPQARLTKSATQAMASDFVYRQVTFDGTEYDRNHGGTPHFDDANDRLICRVPGLYLVTATMQFSPWSGTAYVWSAYIYKNGAGAIYQTGTHPSIGLLTTYSAPLELAVDDYVELWARHNSSGGSSVLTNTVLGFARLGDAG